VRWCLVKAPPFFCEVAHLRPFFLNLHLGRVILEIMINLSMALNNRPKNQTQPEIKNQSKLSPVFSRTFKVQKHLI